MAIYTKTGDKGQTSLYSSKQEIKRVFKNSLVIRTIGAVDEVNSYLGIVISTSLSTGTRKKLEHIQENLFTIGAILAGAEIRFERSEIKLLEKEIDRIEGTLPPLAHFILPGGSEIAAQVHYLRALTRKAERVMASLAKKQEIKPEISAYMNRLSDYFFMLAREINHNENIEEKKWNVRTDVHS